MSITIFDEPEVQITSVIFRATPGETRLESYPKRMVLDGREVNFVEQGMRYLVQKGQDLIKLFDVSDGQNDYRLRLEGSNRWTLVGTKVAA
ncbi:MAG: hypothetical protein JWO35_85 [Candidatus Saccharibacteria bacterium]|nr:hypothetical protein [Candidatus Saccharibacteria bacterium]